jgi:hypothetical protein
MKKLITTISCLCFASALMAQVQRCGTTEYYELRKKTDPALQQRMNDLEKQVATWIEKNPQGIRTLKQNPVQFPLLPEFKATGDEKTDRLNYAKQKEIFLSKQKVSNTPALILDEKSIKQLREKKLKDHSTFTTK